jgi:hypothetical protein
MNYPQWTLFYQQAPPRKTLSGDHQPVPATFPEPTLLFFVFLHLISEL